MKKIFSTLSNTYKTFKLLSNPRVTEMLFKELQKEIVKGQIKQIEGQTFYHRYFSVQIVG